jgi:4'-phosphopantetheinyl transferase
MRQSHFDVSSVSLKCAAGSPSFKSLFIWIDMIDDHDTIRARWIVLDGDTAAAPLRQLLDASENAQADRFRVAADRDAYIAAHALLRTMLSRQTSIGPAEWRFRMAEGGKPIVDPAQAPPGLHFSLSHTRGLAACAVGRSGALGIDAEAWCEPAPIELAERYFAPAEARLVATRAPEERPAAFYRLWTLKEAYLKATGRGLAAALDSFAFSLDPTELTLPPPGSPAAWQFAEFRPGLSHSLALAVHSPAPVPIDAAAGSPFACVARKMQSTDCGGLSLPKGADPRLSSREDVTEEPLC